MICAQAEAHFSAFLDGTLEDAACAALEAHLMVCAACRARVDGVKGVTTVLAQAPPVPVPPGLTARVLAALAAAEGPESVRSVSPEPGFVLECAEALASFTAALEDTLDSEERRAFDCHVGGCDPCALQYRQFVAVVQLLASVPSGDVPADLVSRVTHCLAHAEQAPAPQTVRDAAVLRAVVPRSRGRWLHALSGLGGALATAAALFVWSMLPGVGVPRLEARAVAVSQDVAVHIQFEADERLDGVVFQVDLPEGLQFIDDGSAPLLARSVSWRGALEKGKTVVPIVVRGSRPGNYTIEAVVRKGPLLRRTAVVLPVEG